MKHTLKKLLVFLLPFAACKVKVTDNSIPEGKQDCGAYSETFVPKPKANLDTISYLAQRQTTFSCDTDNVWSLEKADPNQYRLQFKGQAYSLAFQEDSGQWIVFQEGITYGTFKLYFINRGGIRIAGHCTHFAIRLKMGSAYECLASEPIL